MSTGDMSSQVLAIGSPRASARRSTLALGAFWLILLLATAWRTIGIHSTDVWRDEAISLIHAHASWWALATRLPFVEDSPPLYFLLLKGWSLLFDSEWSMRLSSVLIGVGTVAAIMKVARMIHPSSWAPAGLLAAVSHQPVHFSQELRGYGLLVLLVVLCFWSAERVRREPDRRLWLVLLGLFAALCAHFHVVGLFVFPMIWVYLLARLLRPTFGVLFSPWMLGTWLIGCVPVVAFSLYWVFQHRTTGFWIPPVSKNTPLDLLQQFTGLEVVYLWIYTDAPARLTEVLGDIAAIPVHGGYLVLAVMALVTPATRRAAVGLLGGTLLFVGFMVATSVMGVPNMIARTLVPAWVPALFLFAIGAVPQGGWGDTSLRRAGLMVVLVISAVSWVWMAGFSSEPRRPSGVESLCWLEPQVGPADLIVITPSWVEDLVAYHLRDRVAGEQLFTIDAPVYAGRPPRHTLAHSRITITPGVIDRGPWVERIDQAIRGRQGQDYSVWLVCTTWQDLWNDPVLKQLRRVFRDRFECVDRYTPEEIDSLTINRLVLRDSPAVATGPADTAPADPPEHE